MADKSDVQSLLRETHSGKSPSWKPGDFRRFPFLGFSALLAYLATAAAAVSVLSYSDKKITDNWSRPPNTYLSALAVLGNIFLSIAFVEGLTLSYWRKFNKGTTVAGLHYHWNAGQSFAGACEGIIRGFGLLNGLAFIAWAVSSARSPINQNAVGFIANMPFATNGSMRVEVAQKLPEGYTGKTTYARSTIAQTSSLTSSFSNIMLDYSNRQSLTLSHNRTDCGDSCDTTVNSFGFSANCTTEVGVVAQPSMDNLGMAFPLFSTSVEIWGNISQIGYKGGLNVTSSYQNNKTGIQKQYTRTCLLQTSIMKYPITITSNDTVALRSTWDKDNQIKSLNYSGPISISAADTTIGGFQLAMSNIFSSSAKFQWDGPVSSVNFAGTVVNQYVDTANSENHYNWPNDVNWNDPTDDMLNAIRGVAFRTSLYAASDSSYNETVHESWGCAQDVEYTGTIRKTIYKTDWRYATAGAALALLGFFGILPLYYGWWQLGRRVTMSPVEIAKAFDSRLLADMKEHDAKKLARAGKTLKIRYALAHDAGALG